MQAQRSLCSLGLLCDRHQWNGLWQNWIVVFSKLLSFEMKYLPVPLSPQQLPGDNTLHHLCQAQLFWVPANATLCSRYMGLELALPPFPLGKIHMQIKWGIRICIWGHAAKSNTMTTLTKYYRHFLPSFSACHPLNLVGVEWPCKNVIFFFLPKLGFSKNREGLEWES